MRKLGAVLMSIASVGVACAAASCHANPSIDGSKVPTVGSPTDAPTCAQVCARLQALCGYGPPSCTTAARDGYCDTQLTDPNERICIGYGTDNGHGGYNLTVSCEAAWDCVANEPVPDASDDASDDAIGDGAPTP